MPGSERTIAGSDGGFQIQPPRRPGTGYAAALVLLLALGACSGAAGDSTPEVYARWSGGGLEGAARVLVTARSASPIAAAELQDPQGRSFAARGLSVGDTDRDYGVTVQGGSDTGVSLGLSLDILARAMDPPPQRRSASIPLPPDAATAYRRSWQGWRLSVRFADGPTLVQPAPEPRD